MANSPFVDFHIVKAGPIETIPQQPAIALWINLIPYFLQYAGYEINHRASWYGSGCSVGEKAVHEPHY
jgi:hypothetical protein